ncbi:hypothetical protein BDN72DRAFT_906064 [Pluteus cervinus]|uniref:Uncharacterized protein n=1 Tax=Pluteus cervinus TaxID=181527 RepID=A0ACD3A1B0_9AGAR|nr:hypothetical protein BDN72DRAFT_906064 [Pluteus cervinus]
MSARRKGKQRKVLNDEPPAPTTPDTPSALSSLLAATPNLTAGDSALASLAAATSSFTAGGESALALAAANLSGSPFSFGDGGTTSLLRCLFGMGELKAGTENVSPPRQAADIPSIPLAVQGDLRTPAQPDISPQSDNISSDQHPATTPIAIPAAIPQANLTEGIWPALSLSSQSAPAAPSHADIRLHPVSAPSLQDRIFPTGIKLPSIQSLLNIGTGYPSEPSGGHPYSGSPVPHHSLPPILQTRGRELYLPSSTIHSAVPPPPAFPSLSSSGFANPQRSVSSLTSRPRTPTSVTAGSTPDFGSRRSVSLNSPPRQPLPTTRPNSSTQTRAPTWGQQPTTVTPQASSSKSKPPGKDDSVSGGNIRPQTPPPKPGTVRVTLIATPTEPDKPDLSKARPTHSFKAAFWHHLSPESRFPVRESGPERWINETVLSRFSLDTPPSPDDLAFLDQSIHNMQAVYPTDPYTSSITQDLVSTLRRLHDAGRRLRESEDIWNMCDILDTQLDELSKELQDQGVAMDQMRPVMYALKEVQEKMGQ